MSVACLIAGSGCAGSDPARTSAAPSVAPSPASTEAKPSPALTQQAQDERVIKAAALAGRASPPARFLAPGVAESPWDRDRYLANPVAYVDLVVAGRAESPAQPAADIPMLSAVGSTAAVIPPGGSTRLRATTAPGMPVTFTSFGLGAFANQQASITVAADIDGVATVEFRAPPGTEGPCPIHAASPVRGGILQFLVRVVKE